MAFTAEEYKKYRQAARELSTKMMDKSLKGDVLNAAGRLLGLVRGNVFIFDSETETNALADLALHECLVGKKNAAEMYREEIGGKDEREKHILAALASSYTSLFKVVAVSRSDHSGLRFGALQAACGSRSACGHLYHSRVFWGRQDRR